MFLGEKCPPWDSFLDGYPLTMRTGVQIVLKSTSLNVQNNYERARHVYNIGVDLGMPTGVLSKLGDKVSVDELIELDLDNLIIEGPILKMFKQAKCLKELQIINALDHPELIRDAVEGKHVGTIIYK